jgi:dienelactone hydrolase
MKKIFVLLPLIVMVLSCLTFFLLRGNPKIQVNPTRALFDEPVEIIVSNLASHQQIIIEALRNEKDNSILLSRAVFEADDKGFVNVAAQSPVSGSYNGIDPMGLFWSMTLVDKATSHQTLQNDEVSLSVFSQDKLLAQKTIYRLPVSPDVEERDIHDQGVVGTLLYPKTMKSSPGIIVVTGSSGGIPKTLARLLASHGYAVLALGYFGVEGLPSNLENIPLEYFQNAMQWFKKQPQVNSDKVALLGGSYGGELVLLLASTFPKEMNAVVAYVPSGLVYGGIPEMNKPAWTYKSAPIPFMPFLATEEIFSAIKEGKVPFHKGTVEDPQQPTLLYLYGLEKFSDAIESSMIPVENIRCPILILSGEDDKLWPSTLYGNLVMERLEKRGSTIERKHIHFSGAGHLFELPYVPSAPRPYYHPIVKLWCTMGGTAEGNARAGKESWSETLSFLKQYLQ